MRIRAAGVVTTMTLTLLIAGCGGDTAEPGAAGHPSAQAATGELVIWADDKRAAALKPFADKFGTENGVTVKIQAISKDQQTTFVTASQQGSGPDVMVGAHDWIGNLVQNGAIDPVPMTDAKKALFRPASIQGITFNSQTYGVPFAVENVALYRNTTLAPTAPTTWEELLASSTQLKSEGKVTELLSLPIDTSGSPAPYHTYAMFTSAGGQVFGKNADGSYDPKQFLMGSPASVAAMAKIAALGSSGSGLLKTSIGNSNYSSVFTDGKSAYMVAGPWALPAVKKSGIPYAISPMPKFEGGQEARPFLGVQTLYVASKGKNKAVAQEFATNFFPTTDVAVALFNADPRPPALLSAYEAIAATDPDMQAFAAAAENGDLMPSITQMAVTFDPWGKALAAMVEGADPTTTTQQMVANIQSKLGG